MQEYLSEAVVLGIYPNGDMDARISLFTKKFGKLVAKAKSVKKINSKLAGHLQPGNLVRVRLVEKNGLQAADALKSSRLNIKPMDLYFLNNLLPEAEPDLELWQAITGGLWSWREILRIFGWDPREASCRLCRKPPAYFHIGDQEFLCSNCASKFKPDDIIFIK